MKAKKVIFMSDKLLPLAAMEKIIKKVGGSNIRVSDKAKVALKEVIELKAEEIAEKAWRLATHAGRKTVKEDDIKLAVKQ
ncbi:MAG: histone [Nanoarchaeota archaeon]